VFVMKAGGANADVTDIFSIPKGNLIYDRERASHLILAKVEKMNPFFSNSDFEDLAGHALILADVVLLPERGRSQRRRTQEQRSKGSNWRATTVETAFTTRGKHVVRRF